VLLGEKTNKLGGITRLETASGTRQLDRVALEAMVK